MATTQSFNIAAHHNIYNGSNERELRIDFAVPESGTNAETGLLVFVPGFGGHIDSNVYKKMREQLSDMYNVVTVQCDYFGSRFMQSADNIDLNDKLNDMNQLFTATELEILTKDISQMVSILSNKSETVFSIANQGETINEFADMGYMQAIDVIIAIEVIHKLLIGNNLLFDKSRVIGFGQSQGAYLLHLCNRLVPHLFSMIIDNAAWTYPAYLNSNRVLSIPISNSTLIVEFDYLAKRVINNQQALSLDSLYKKFDNGAYIYSCLGTTDHLVNIEGKREILKNLKFVDFEIIDQNKVDGEIFKSTNHGLDADFLKLIEYVHNKNIQHVNTNEKKMQYDVISSSTIIHVDYSQGLPLFTFEIVQ